MFLARMNPDLLKIVVESNKSVLDFIDCLRLISSPSLEVIKFFSMLNSTEDKIYHIYKC